MSCYPGSKISWSQQPFFTATAICIVKRWKWSMGYCFAPECNHTQESHTCQFFFFFFLPDLQDHSLLRSRHFATMVTQHDNFSPLLQSLQTLQESCIYIHLLKLSASDHKYTCIHGWNGRQQYIYIYIFLTSDNLLKCAVKTHFYDQAMIIHVQCTVSISTWPKGGVKFSAFVVFR